MKNNRRGRKHPCPFQLLKEYIKFRGPRVDDREPFFAMTDKSPLTPQQMRLCLKQALLATGFDASLYGVHSLRIGRTTDLLKLGLSVETIKKLGRWRSNAVFRYLR